MSIKTPAEMVSDLLGSGLSYKALAALVPCDTSTVYRIKTGFILDPKYSVGSAIARLHADICQQAA